MTDLIALLRRIRDGRADVAEVERARELARADARLPEDLRRIALVDDDDLEGDAAGLLAVLGADDLGGMLTGAIVAEAGRPPPMDDVIDEAALDAQHWTLRPDLVAAVRREAGEIDVVDAVMAELRPTMPASVVPPRPERSAPANDTRAYAALGLLLAAAGALLVSLVGLDTGVEPLPELVYAHPDEVVVEDLTAEADVLMLQGGPDGAVILWVDEET